MSEKHVSDVKPEHAEEERKRLEEARKGLNEAFEYLLSKQLWDSAVVEDRKELFADLFVNRNKEAEQLREGSETLSGRAITDSYLTRPVARLMVTGCALGFISASVRICVSKAMLHKPQKGLEP